MRIGMPDWPKLDEPITVQYEGWWAVWHGGEYINIYRNEAGARKDERNENTHPDYAVDARNTTGDEFDPDDPVQYVKDEIMSWVATDARYY